MSIESRIREQKEKIKEDQRELSRLQDEARKKEEPVKIDVSNISIEQYTLHDTAPIPAGFYTIKIELYFNKCPDLLRIKSAIESLSDSEPKSYVDWNKIPKGYNWVAIDKSRGHPWAYRETGEKIIKKNVSWGHVSGFGGVEDVGMDAIIGPLPPWDKSLIHRPGAKE